MKVEDVDLRRQWQVAKSLLRKARSSQITSTTTARILTF
jgi:hypothetical protein